jgi:hypothetical protein
MRVIVAGSRTFWDYGYLCKILDEYKDEISELVSGCARGADTLGIMWAEENDVPVAKFPAQWSLYGKSAGYKRNVEMAKHSDALIAFWSGESVGTAHMIDIARKYNLPVFVYDI